MRGRFHRKEDSLDLLLNTICDVFGSFILIALILALPVAVKEVVKPQIDEDTLSRRIEAAQKEQEEIQKRIAATQVDPEVADLSRTKLQLEQLIKNLSEESAKADKARVDSLQIAARDVAKEDKQLQAEIEAAKLQQESARNALQAAIREKEQVLDRISALKGKVSSAKSARIQEMRLPKERETSKIAIPVIFKFGRIFPLYSSLSTATRNTDSLEWIRIDEDRDRVNPIESKGWPPNQVGLIESWVSELPSDAFLACYVYQDSVDAFREFRKIASKKGADLGWEPVESGKNLSFGSEGSSPKPQ